MSDLGTTSGSRNIRIPENNEIPFGEKANWFLRSFSGLNLTKFSILYNVPHGTYLGGYANSTTDLSQAEPMGQKTGLFFGYRKLPNMISNSSNAGFRNSQKYVRAIDDSGTSTSSITTPFNMRISEVNRTWSLLEQEQDYLLFDMNRTFVWPILTQYPYVLNHESGQKGYTPFYKVSEITPSARDPKKLYITPNLSDENINIISSDKSMLLSTVEHGGLFCLQYYYINSRASGDNLPANGTSVKFASGAFANPGVANVIFMEFGNTENKEYVSSDEEPSTHAASFSSASINDAFNIG